MTTIYTKNSCQPCRLTKMAFDRAGIQYEEINLDDNPEALQTIKELGYSSAPVVVDADSGMYWSGLRPDMIQKVIKST